jgi:hypothetical protein
MTSSGPLGTPQPWKRERPLIHLRKTLYGIRHANREWPYRKREDKVGTTSAELDKLSQGNRELSQYYAEFQRLMAIPDYDANAKQAALKRGFSRELQSSLVYQVEELEEFSRPRSHGEEGPFRHSHHR